MSACTSALPGQPSPVHVLVVVVEGVPSLPVLVVVVVVVEEEEYEVELEELCSSVRSR